MFFVRCNCIGNQWSFNTEIFLAYKKINGKGQNFVHILLHLFLIFKDIPIIMVYPITYNDCKTSSYDK